MPGDRSSLSFFFGTSHRVRIVAFRLPVSIGGALHEHGAEGVVHRVGDEAFAFDGMGDECVQFRSRLGEATEAEGLRRGQVALFVVDEFGPAAPVETGRADELLEDIGGIAEASEGLRIVIVEGIAGGAPGFEDPADLFAAANAPRDRQMLEDADAEDVIEVVAGEVEDGHVHLDGGVAPSHFSGRGVGMPAEVAVDVDGDDLVSAVGEVAGEQRAGAAHVEDATAGPEGRVGDEPGDFPEKKPGDAKFVRVSGECPVVGTAVDVFPDAGPGVGLTVPGRIVGAAALHAAHEGE